MLCDLRCSGILSLKEEKFDNRLGDLNTTFMLQYGSDLPNSLRILRLTDKDLSPTNGKTNHNGFFLAV